MTEETTDTGLPENEFDLAFEAAITGEVEDSDIVAEEVETPEAEIDEPEVETPEAEVEEPEEETPEQDEEPSEAEPPEAETPEVETPAEDSVKKVVTETVAEIEAKKQAERDAAAAEAKAKEEADTQAEEAKLRETLTEAEITAIEQMKKDFPEVAEAFEAQQRVAMAKIENAYTKKLKEVVAQIEERIAPISSVTQSMAHNAHETAILAAHADAFEILPAVEKWVAEQPSFLQPAYNEVLDNGSSKDVIGFLSMFKEVTGSKARKTPVEDDIAKTKAAAVAQEKEAKLQAQEGVRSRRTEKSDAIDPNDFEGAFKKYASQA